MFLVAIRSDRTVAEGLGDALADSTGLPRYETRARLRVLAGWPGILASYADEGEAHAVAAAVQRLGMAGWVMRGGAVEPRAVARSFSVAGDRLVVVADAERTHDVDVASVSLLLAGRMLGVSFDSHVEKGDRAPGMASGIARGLMGLPTMGSIPVTVQTRKESRESFVHLYASGHPTLVFSERSVRYATVDGAMEPTRAANFARVVQTLRELCPAAAWDDRLTQRRWQSRLLGPTLRPEAHLDLAIALITRERGVASDPYR